MASCGNGGGGGVHYLFFGTGSQVEVCSDDEGFRGSWYVATIIDIDYNEPLPSSSSNKKKRKMETRYLVEYATLLDDGADGDEDMSKNPLKEYVDGSFMRPLPPPTENQHTYELNDVVDAFHRDGWWTGFVKRVVDGGLKFVVFFQNPPEEVEFTRSDLRVHHDWVDCKWVRAEKKEITEHKSEGDSHDRKRGRPKKVVIESPTGKEKNGAESASHATGKDCGSLHWIQSLNHGFPSQLPQRKYNIVDNMLDSRLIDKQIRETIGETSGMKPKRRTQRKTNNKSPTQETQDPCIEKESKVFEDQPQLMLCEGLNSPSTVYDSRESFDLNVVKSIDASGRHDEGATRSPAIATSYNNVSQKDKNSVFEKCSPIWEALQHMEIFQKMPQQPHFTPLVMSKQDSREGLAIGHMVIFASVVEKTLKLQFSDPSSIIDSSLETLSDLETHGFDVDPVRHRLNELLLKKENQGHLLEESKALETKITEQYIKKMKIGEEIREFNKKMEELQENLALATSTEKVTDYEIDALTLKMDTIDQDLQSAQHDFERLAAAPW